MYDVACPLLPEYVGCEAMQRHNGQVGYTQDAQCVIYHGPDANYTGKEVCAAIYCKYINMGFEVWYTLSDVRTQTGSCRQGLKHLCVTSFFIK